MTSRNNNNPNNIPKNIFNLNEFSSWIRQYNRRSWDLLITTVMRIGSVDDDWHLVQSGTRTEILTPHCLQWNLNLFSRLIVVLPKTNCTQKLDTLKADTVSYKVVMRLDFIAKMHKTLRTLLWSRKFEQYGLVINPFVPNAPFFYSMGRERVHWKQMV